MRKYLPKSFEMDELAQWYMRYISPLALIGGFFADNLILFRRADVWTRHALLFSYLLIAALCIIALNLITTGRIRTKRVLKVTPIIPVVAQFAFGGLFSGYLSLYSRSASFPLSWIFVVIVAGLLLGNERFVRLYMRFSFQISMLFAVLFSFLIFLLPELLKRERTRVARIIAVIFIIFNILFFSNAIPPLPLALKAAGIYHSVERTQDGVFHLGAESQPWYWEYVPHEVVFHHTPGGIAYAYSAVFAPSGISTVILHEWQRYHE